MEALSLISLSSSVTTFWKILCFCNFDQSNNKITLFRAQSDVIIILKKQQQSVQAYYAVVWRIDLSSLSVGTFMSWL